MTVNGFELKSWWGWNFVHIQVEGNKSYRCNGKLRIQFAWQEGRRWIGDPADVELDPDVI